MRYLPIGYGQSPPGGFRHTPYGTQPYVPPNNTGISRPKPGTSIANTNPMSSTYNIPSGSNGFTEPPGGHAGIQGPRPRPNFPAGFNRPYSGGFSRFGGMSGGRGPYPNMDIYPISPYGGMGGRFSNMFPIMGRGYGFGAPWGFHARPVRPPMVTRPDVEQEQDDPYIQRPNPPQNYAPPQQGGMVSASPWDSIPWTGTYPGRPSDASQ